MPEGPSRLVDEVRDRREPPVRALQGRRGARPVVFRTRRRSPCRCTVIGGASRAPVLGLTVTEVDADGGRRSCWSGRLNSGPVHSGR